MHYQEKISGTTIYLKKLGEENATPEYCSWLNDSEVNRYLETRKTTVDELKKYITEKNSSDDCLFLGIFYKANDKHIGNIKLEPINLKEKTATVGILIGDKDYWRKGIATEAISELAEYAFNELDLNEINLGVISENKAAIRVYEKAGFAVEKIEEKAIRHGNELFDRIVMAKRK